MIKILLAGALCTVAFSATVVVPNANTSVAGNDASGLPTTPTAAEIQTVFNAGQFPTGPIQITGFTFRAAPGTGAFSVTVSGNIFLSTTSKVANNPPGPLLSTTFANNVGPDVTQVASLSGATLNGAGCAVSGTTPCPFANNIVFTTPFSYNQANGSLLFDLKATSLVGIGSTDRIDCSVATCVTSSVTGALGSPTGSANNPGGSITQFTYTTAPSGIPVPPSILITMIGLACVGFYVGRRGFAKFA